MMIRREGDGLGLAGHLNGNTHETIVFRLLLRRQLVSVEAALRVLKHGRMLRTQAQDVRLGVEAVLGEWQHMVGDEERLAVPLAETIAAYLRSNSSFA